MSTVSVALLLSAALASVALAAGRAGPSAQRARHGLRVVCRGALPFDQAALLAAIRLRLRPAPAAVGAPTTVEVMALSRGRVSIRAGAAQRVISLEGLSGVDAARVVALLSLDLIAEARRARPPTGASPPAAASPDPATRTPRLRLRSASAPAASSQRVFIGGAARMTLRGNDFAPTFQPTLDVALTLSARLGLFLEGGFTWTRGGSDERVVRLYELPAASGLTLRWRWLEARLGFALRAYFARGAGEDSGALLGASGSLRARHRFSGGLVGFAALGVDVYSARKRFEVGGTSVLQTSWLVPWLAVGAGWQGGR